MVAHKGSEHIQFVGTCGCKTEGSMSKRHQRRETILPPKVEIRAHAHNERHRVNALLHEVTNLIDHGVEPQDVVEPGPNFKPSHHHDAEIGRQQAKRHELRHWKTKDWKRRTAARKQRAIADWQLRRSA